jgi:putative phosphoribosyl transferase
MANIRERAMPRPSRRFLNRRQAGKELAKQLQKYANAADVIVLGLPRGGVPVAAEISRSLKAPLDLCLVRKLGAPGHKELALGAIALGGVQVLNHKLVTELGISEQTIATVKTRELQELQRRDLAYRGDRPPPLIRDRRVILVDDGLATGSSMKAAILWVKSQQPALVVVAIPVAPIQTCHQLQNTVDEVVCLLTPEPFTAIGLWYQDFAQTTDQEVQSLLAQEYEP